MAEMLGMHLMLCSYYSDIHPVSSFSYLTIIYFGALVLFPLSLQVSESMFSLAHEKIQGPCESKYAPS